MNIEILLTALITAMATSLVGVFLVLRRLSMLTDAISHTVLLGIVLAFMVVGNLTSPFLLVGATLMGILTVYFIEILIKTKHIKEDASIGVVFTLLFAIAIIIINTQFRNVHLDVDMVLLGSLEFIIFDRLSIGFIDLPISLFIMGIVLIINGVLITVFYKEIKLVSFDYALGSALGFMPLLIHYVMMSTVSLTAVAAFNAVGAILVIAFMIGPPITALFYTKTLFKTLILTLIIASLNATLGYFISYFLDVTISGTIASLILFSFLLSLVFAPKKGVVGKMFKLRQQKEVVKIATLIVHIINHRNTKNATAELNPKTLHKHMHWKEKQTQKLILKAKKQKLLYIENEMLNLSQKGKAYYNSLEFINGGET